MKKNYQFALILLILISFHAHAQVVIQKQSNGISVLAETTLEAEATVTPDTLFFNSEHCGTQNTDSATAVSDPWYGNNQYLTNLLTAQGFYNSSCNICRTSSNCNPLRFHIPVEVWLYRNDAGAINNSIPSVAAVEAIFRRVNEIYRLSNLNNPEIFFYLTSVNVINSSRFESIETNLAEQEFLNMFRTNINTNAVNIHFIRRNTGISTPSGLAIMPSIFGLVPKRSAYVRTNRNEDNTYRGQELIAQTTAHELGHVFDLKHTHSPGRWTAGIFTNGTNARAPYCYQEFQDRGKVLRAADACFAQGGNLACEVNADFLCDTDADPDVSRGIISAATPAPGCVYDPPDNRRNWQRDRDGATWTPPTRNLMSYSDVDCALRLSDGQVGVLWNNIPRFGPPLLSINGFNSVGYTDAEFSLPVIQGATSTWSTSSNLQIVSQNNQTVVVRGVSGTTGEAWIDVNVITPYGNFCLNKFIQVSPLSVTITGPGTARTTSPIGTREPSLAATASPT